VIVQLIEDSTYAN